MGRLLFLVVIYGLLSSISHASSPSYGQQGRYSNDSHSGSSSSSQLAVEQINSDSSSDSQINSSDQTIMQVRNRYEEAAQAVNSLNLAYCADGGGAGDKSASFNVGGVSYVCEVAQSIPQMLSAIPSILKAAESYPAGSNIRKAEIAKAKKILDEVYVIVGEELPSYIHSRSNTAAFGAFFRDTWFVWGLLLIAL